MHNPGSTEWPIWHDHPGRDQQELDAPSRHDIALARYLEAQQAHRELTARRFDPVAVLDRAHALAVREAKNAVQLIDGIGLTLSKAHSQFSKTLWGR